MRPIVEIAQKLDLSPDDIEPYGHLLAKLSWRTAERVRQGRPRGKLLLVSAMTPTKYGEGKTTTTIALAQGLARKGVRVVAALREPSFGPIFGAKGGGTGGGKARLEPSARINMHCTGDLHAITQANNLLASLVDNAIHYPLEGVKIRAAIWRRCIDLNDRFLRNAVIGLGGSANGTPREDGFDITAASEIMATLCLSEGLADLKTRLGRLIVGTDDRGQPVTAAALRAVGAVASILGDAMLPNLAQTNEGVPVFVHGGPFANIAHGCSSIAATRSALALGDVAITEAGFGFDLGGEKFLDLKCRQAGLWPHLVVLVVTARAIRAHGGDRPGLAALEAGFSNVARHLHSIRSFGLTPVVALNVFANDPEADLEAVERLCAAHDAKVARNRGFLDGGAGAEGLAEAVLAAMPEKAPVPRHPYALEDSFESKVRAIAKTVYGAGDVELTGDARRALARFGAWGAANLPVCVAKTHLSLTDDPTIAGAPSGFTLTVRDVRYSAGAGFLLALTGEILTMPGLPKAPAAWNFDLDPDGQVTGLA